VLFRVLFRELLLRELLFRAVLFRARLPPLLLLRFRFRVAAAFLAERLRAAADRDADARPPFRPPFRLGALLFFFPRPDPLFLPPPLSLLTVAHARRSASPFEVPRCS
jgi:hypothetical protein